MYYLWYYLFSVDGKENVMASRLHLTRRGRLLDQSLETNTPKWLIALTFRLYNNNSSVVDPLFVIYRLASTV